jgi:hypothetical protein
LPVVPALGRLSKRIASLRPAWATSGDPVSKTRTKNT